MKKEFTDAMDVIGTGIEALIKADMMQTMEMVFTMTNGSILTFTMPKEMALGMFEETKEVEFTSGQLKAAREQIDNATVQNERLWDEKEIALRAAEKAVDEVHKLEMDLSTLQRQMDATLDNNQELSKELGKLEVELANIPGSSRSPLDPEDNEDDLEEVKEAADRGQRACTIYSG